MTKEELVECDKVVHKLVGCGYGVRHSIECDEWPHYRVRVTLKLFNSEEKFEFSTRNTKKEAEQTIKEIRRWYYQK